MYINNWKEVAERTEQIPFIDVQKEDKRQWAQTETQKFHPEHQQTLL